MTGSFRSCRAIEVVYVTRGTDGHRLDIETDVPARMDRLPWSGWHLRVIIALGTSWMLDGLQVTLAGSLAGILGDKHGLGLTTPQITAGATTYLAGAVVAEPPFGYLTDRLGRKEALSCHLGHIYTRYRRHCFVMELL